MPVGDAESFHSIVSCAVLVPAADGRKITSAVHCAPGASCTPALHEPVTVKSLAAVPVRFHAAMTRLAWPPLPSVSGLALLAAPTLASPKLRLCADADNAGTAAAPTPRRGAPYRNDERVEVTLRLDGLQIVAQQMPEDFAFWNHLARLGEALAQRLGRLAGH